MDDEVRAAGAEDASEAPIGQGALGAWWRQGARVAFLREPSWHGLQVTPAVIACLFTTAFAFDLLVQRLYITGPARFYWPALQSGWLSTAATAWVCWLLVPHASTAREGLRAPNAAALFAMMAAQGLVLGLVISVLSVPLVRTGTWGSGALGTWGAWAAWLLPFVWVAAAQVHLAWCSSVQRTGARVLAATLLVGVMLLAQWLQPLRFWYPDESEAGNGRKDPFQLTQEVFEAQESALAAQLKAIEPQRPDRVDVFSITFAPYADEDVFMRESRLVAGVMESRFGAAGHSLQLVNHRDAGTSLPWATPLNLERAIRHMATRMDRDEDVLFIHLTSHGARSGSLATEFWPLSVEAVTPAQLKAWLDAAGIRHRIVSVSACYSGSWIAPLSDEQTLVMTAADADHTSFGCGRRSELTFFGRAMFDEQLRRTWSIETAHAEARKVIEQREKEAGKDDGFSNPQIHVGAALRPVLARLEHERAAAAR